MSDMLMSVFESARHFKTVLVCIAKRGSEKSEDVFIMAVGGENIKVFRGTEHEIRNQLCVKEMSDTIAKMEAENVAAAGLGTCGLQAEEGIGV